MIAGTPFRRFLVETSLVLGWLYLVFAGERERACLVALAQISVLVVVWRQAEALAERCALEAARLDVERERLKREGAELEGIAPTREAVCMLENQILLACGHVVNVEGFPEPLTRRMKKSASCFVCGKDGQT